MNILLCVNSDKDRDYSVSQTVTSVLNKNGATVITFDTNTHAAIPITHLTDMNSAFSDCDMIITVGGDGTILHIASDAAESDKPILGINMGTIGYMAQVNPSDVESLSRLLTGNYDTERRMMIDASVVRNGETVFSESALNDAVISHGHLSKVVSLTLFGDERLVSEYRADGLIFSTPTGSTAYSISAGGPVVDPVLDAILITPLCAHTLSSRPVLFRSSSVLTARIERSDTDVYLTVDGKSNFRLDQGDTVRIAKSEKYLSRIRFDDCSFYTVLSNKLR